MDVKVILGALRDISPSLGGEVVREGFLEQMTLKKDLKECVRECEWNRVVP